MTYESVKIEEGEGKRMRGEEKGRDTYDTTHGMTKTFFLSRLIAIVLLWSRSRGVDMRKLNLKSQNIF